MASEKQYQFFKSLYDEQTGRERQLQDSARGYLSLATIYSAFILFVVDKLRPDTLAARALFVAAIACMLAAFLISLIATRVSDYEAINDPRSVLEEFGDAPLPDEEFFDSRIADYTVACERNAAVNDKKAARLKIAGYALLLGIVLQACYLVLKAW
jgi:hypothetical protein